MRSKHGGGYRSGETGNWVCFVVGNFAFQFSVKYISHFSDDDVCSTDCAVLFAEEVLGVGCEIYHSNFGVLCEINILRHLPAAVLPSVWGTGTAIMLRHGYPPQRPRLFCRSSLAGYHGVVARLGSTAWILVASPPSLPPRSRHVSNLLNVLASFCLKGGRCSRLGNRIFLFNARVGRIFPEFLCRCCASAQQSGMPRQSIVQWFCGFAFPLQKGA